MKCKDCQEEVQRTHQGKLRSDGRKIYVDKTDREWRGLICPNCRYGDTQRKYGKSIKTQKRFCKCGKVLSVTRYFTCTACQRDLEPDDGDLVYFQAESTYGESESQGYTMDLSLWEET